MMKLLTISLFWIASAARGQEVVHQSNVVRYQDLKNITIYRKASTDSLFMGWCNGGKLFLYRDSVELRAIPGNQTITLSGDVTGSGATSISSTIANNVVTNAKVAQMAANTLKGNNTGSTANAADLTTAQVKTLLAIGESDVSSLTTDLAAKAPLASPTFTGTVTIPTPAFNDNTTKAASTAYVISQIPVYARVTGSNATTTGQALTNITGLSVALTTNAVYEFEAFLSVSTTAVTTGTEYGVNYSVAVEQLRHSCKDR
jgi:hypothetical protein